MAFWPHLNPEFRGYFPKVPSGFQAWISPSPWIRPLAPWWHGLRKLGMSIPIASVTDNCSESAAVMNLYSLSAASMLVMFLILWLTCCNSSWFKDETIWNQACFPRAKLMQRTRSRCNAICKTCPNSEDSFHTTRNESPWLFRFRLGVCFVIHQICLMNFLENNTCDVLLDPDGSSFGRPAYPWFLLLC